MSHYDIAVIGAGAAGLAAGLALQAAGKSFIVLEARNRIGGRAHTDTETLGLPFGAYANGFSQISGLPLPDDDEAPDYTHRHDLTPEKYADFALRWVAMGAALVGGCCEVGPAHIRHLAERLRAEGHQIA